MNDFGEALPFDAKLYDGSDPAVWHNRYPEEWQRVNREAIEESGHGDDMLFFSRSGYTKSPGIATLFWLGDQLMSWDEYDGIKTALVGILSGGISGYSMMHTDVGGYVALKVMIEGKPIPIINRTPELFKRWAELNAFTAVMRATKASRRTCRCSSTARPKFSRISRAARRSTKDWPLTGNAWLRKPRQGHSALPASLPALPGRPQHARPALPVPARARRDGRACADKGAETVDVYFPPDDEWTDLWTGANVGKAGSWVSCQRP